MNRLLLLALILIASKSTVAQIPGYVPTNGLQAWYSFDGNVNDLSGNGNTPVNTGATFETDRFGNSAAALDFDGISAVMTLSNPTFKFSETGRFTYSVWVNKRTQSSAGVVLMSGVATTGYFISIIQGVSVEQFGTNMQQSAWTWATCPHTLNVWDHYVAVYDAGTMSFYKNGVLSASAIYPYSGAIADFMPFYFGRGLPGGGNNYNGLMDDIGVWSRALTLPEIQTLYASSTTQVNETDSEKAFYIYSGSSPEEWNVRIPEKMLHTDYQLLDATGRIVRQDNFSGVCQRLDVSGLPAGVYLLNASGVTRRFVIS